MFLLKFRSSRNRRTHPPLARRDLSSKGSIIFGPRQCLSCVHLWLIALGAICRSACAEKTTPGLLGGSRAQLFLTRAPKHIPVSRRLCHPRLRHFLLHGAQGRPIQVAFPGLTRHAAIVPPRHGQILSALAQPLPLCVFRSISVYLCSPVVKLFPARFTGII